MGIEPTYPAWKAGVLPLNYTRMMICYEISRERIISYHLFLENARGNLRFL